MENIKATQESIKERNIGLVLRNIKEDKQISRIKLSKITKLAKSTISDLVNFLIKENIVSESEKANSKIGKKPITIKFNKNYFFIIGVDIGIEKISVVIANLFGEIIEKIEEKNNKIIGRDKILNNIFITIDTLLSNANIDIKAKGLISISTHGVVNPETKIISNAPYLKDWDGINLVNIFRKKYKTDVLVENCKNLGAIAEKYKYYENIENLIYLEINYGIGAGIIINNKLITGKNGTMGEISYLPILNKNSYLKFKENKFGLGIFESQVDINGIVNIVNRELQKNKRNEEFEFSKVKGNLDFDSICDYYNKSSKNFIEKIIDNQVIKILTIGIASIIAIVDTEIVIINGAILKLGNKFIEKLINEVSEISPFDVKIVVSKLGENAHIEGAISNGINYFNNLLYNNFFSLLKKRK